MTAPLAALSVSQLHDRIDALAVEHDALPAHSDLSARAA